MDRFEEGQEVKSVYWSEGELIVGQYDITKIVVVMENGQMTGVPWFAVFKNGELYQKVNGALLEGVVV